MTHNQKQNKNTDNSIDLFNELFYRELKEMTPFKFFFEDNNLTHKTTNPDDNLLEIEYKLNSYGYRSNSFNGKAKLMTLGCSHSFGVGMLDEFTWSSILAKKLNLDFARLAMSGDSAQGQVTKAFQYFKEFGHPEIIVGTFPVFRMEMPYIEGKFESEQLKKQNDRSKIQQIFFYNESFPKYAKAPFDPNLIIPKELGIFYSFLFISFLEQYCNSNNILFLWNTYEDDKKVFYDFIKNHQNTDNVNNIFKNYVSKKINKTEVFSGTPDFPENCHQEYANHILFNHAADLEKPYHAHWGIHKHIHVAEEFYNEIIKRKQFDIVI